ARRQDAGHVCPGLDFDRAHQGRAAARARRADCDTLAQLPDIPAVAEFVPGYEASYWSGLGAPRHTPPAIVESLNREVNAPLADPAIKTRLEALDASPMPGSPADFGELIADETERWGRAS